MLVRLQTGTHQLVDDLRGDCLYAFHPYSIHSLVRSFVRSYARLFIHLLHFEFFGYDFKMTALMCVCVCMYE